METPPLVALRRTWLRRSRLLSTSRSSCRQFSLDCIVQLEPPDRPESYYCHYFLAATSSRSVEFHRPLHMHRPACECTPLHQPLKTPRVAANRRDRLKNSLRLRSDRRESNPLPSTLVQARSIAHWAAGAYTKSGRHNNFPTALRSHRFHRCRGYSKQCPKMRVRLMPTIERYCAHVRRPRHLPLERTKRNYSSDSE